MRTASKNTGRFQWSCIVSAGIVIGALLCNLLAVAAAAQNAATNSPLTIVFPRATSPDISLRNEVQRAIDKGLAWLEKNQDTNGVWSTPDYPAITALALASFQMQAEKGSGKAESSTVKKGYAYLLSCVQPDGGIYRKELPSYNTSISLVALLMAHRPEYLQTILKARRFIVGLQADYGEPGKVDNVLDGGIGYGTTNKTPDLSNTEQALEALAFTKRLIQDRNLPGDDVKDLNWDAAIHFIQSCQNLPSHNHESWVSGDPQNKGGFIYAPGASKAGETNLPSGRVALRSYGSMSYAGLLSYIYADLKPDDPRVSAVMEWLESNYTLDENPGMGAQGLFYYYHTMAKALTFYGTSTLMTKGGRTVKWREELTLKLINLQHADGSWANENGRWFEKDPALVTSYALLTLGMLKEKL